MDDATLLVDSRNALASGAIHRWTTLILNPATGGSGTGVRIRVDDHFFVATAAHVVSGGTPLLVRHGPGSEDWDRVIQVGESTNPTIDLAWLEVQPNLNALDEADWLPLDRVGLERRALAPWERVIIHGYPGSLVDHRERERTITAEAWGCLTCLIPLPADHDIITTADSPPSNDDVLGYASSQLPAIFARSPFAPLASNWVRTPRLLVPAVDLLVALPLQCSARDEQGQRVFESTPSPRGMSGAGVWSLGLNAAAPTWSTADVRLVGLLRQHAPEGGSLLHDVAVAQPFLGDDLLLAIRAEAWLKKVGREIARVSSSVSARLGMVEGPSTRTAETG